MKRLSIGAAILAAILVGIWILFSMRFAQSAPPWLVWVVLGSVTLLWVIATLVLMLLSIRRARRIETQLTGAGGGGGAMQEMYDQFQRSLQALKSSPQGQGALATMPWYLVIGAPGSGKTTALQESGLSFSTMGQGLRAIRGIGGTRNCDWWFTDEAIFLDTAGRYTTQAEDQGEWHAFLDLLKGNRRGPTVNGVIVVVSVADLLKKDEAGMAAYVQPIRERVDELGRRLGLVLPVYVVFSKADLVGGFKDFFANLTRSERDQVWGATLAYRREPGSAAKDLYHREVGRLLSGVQARRLAAMSVDRPDEQMEKIYLFPTNFLAVQKWLGEFIGELFRPGAHGDRAVFRGFYFTSGVQVSKLPEGVNAAPFSAGDGPKPKAVPPSGVEHSIFISPGSAAGGPIDLPDQRKGIFIKDLFAKVIIPDRSLAGLPARLVKRARTLRAAVLWTSLALGALLAGLMIVSFFIDRGLVGEVRKSIADSILLQRRDPSDRSEIDRLVLILDRVQARGTASSAALADQAHEYYYPQLVRHHVKPLADQVGGELATLRGEAGKSADSARNLAEMYRLYRMLAGELPASPELVERRALENDRWFVAVKGKGELSEEQRLAGRRHLSYLIGRMPMGRISADRRAAGWEARIDSTLANRVKEQVSDKRFYIIDGYTDALGNAKDRLGTVGRDQIAEGEHRALITAGFEFSEVFTENGWESVFKHTLLEKAERITAEMKANGASATVDGTRDALTQMFREDYNRNWLKLLTSIRPTAFRDLSEAASRLRTLSGGQSPYREGLKKLVAAQGFLSESRDILPIHGKWLEDGLDATVELQEAIERFASSTEAGARTRDRAKLEALAATCDKVLARYQAAVKGIDSDAARGAALACLANFIDAAHQALIGELGDELDRQWAATVARPFQETCVGRFPFDAAATAEVPPLPFAKLFNPRDGAYWTAVRAVDELRRITIAGKPLVPVSRDYEKMQSQVTVMKEGLFDGDAGEMAMRFTLVLKPRTGVENISVAIGKEQFDMLKRPDGRCTFTWKAGDPPIAIITAIANTKPLTSNKYGGAGWNVVRLLRDGRPLSRREGGYELTWEFPGASVGRDKVAASADLEPTPFDAMIVGDVFKGFVCASGVVK